MKQLFLIFNMVILDWFRLIPIPGNSILLELERISSSRHTDNLWPLKCLPKMQIFSCCLSKRLFRFLDQKEKIILLLLSICNVRPQSRFRQFVLLRVEFEQLSDLHLLTINWMMRILLSFAQTRRIPSIPQYQVVHLNLQLLHLSFSNQLLHLHQVQ